MKLKRGPKVEHMPPYPTDETTVIPPEANRDKSGRLGHAIPAVALLGVVTIGVVLGGNKILADDGDKNPNPSKPVAEAPLTPSPSQTVETESTVELIADPEGVSFEEYPDPVDAARALEEKRLAFISGDVPTYDDYFQADSELSYDEYEDKFITSIFGDLDRSDNRIRQTLELRHLYSQINEGLQQAYDYGSIPTEVKYSTTLEDMKILEADGLDVRYVPIYAVNTSEIPEDYREKILDDIPQSSQVETDANLEQRNDNWVLGSAS